MRLAFALAERSTCRRLKVGTTISTTDFRKILAVGYNGNASGLPNDCDADTPGACGCLHSEENACISCTDARTVEKIAFVTHQPCRMCAKRIINLGGVTRIYYCHDYRDASSLDLLRSVGIELIRIDVPKGVSA